MKLLKKLSEAAGVSGNEENIRKIIKAEVKDCVDQLYEDAMGNYIAVIKAPKSVKNPKKLMVDAHMDEIGFYVNHIDDRGFLRIINVGGFDTRNLFAREVTVHTKKGEVIGLLNPGIVPLHISSPEDGRKVPELSEFYIDLGLPGNKVKQLVEIGDMVTLKQDFKHIGDIVSGKCLDNRCCVWLGIRMLQKIKKPKFDVYMAFTVQEEVGLRGAQAAAYGIAPDLGIALDTTIGDAPFGVADYKQVSKLGHGVCIKILDGSVICDRRFVDEFKDLAKKKKIPFQLEILPRGGTNTASIQKSRAGVKTGALSIPTRNIHTVTECVHPKDLDGALKLLCAYIEG